MQKKGHSSARQNGNSRVSDSRDERELRKKPRILHPFLLAVFPALSIVSDHVRFLSINKTILGMAIITILVTFLCLFLLTKVARIETQKAGIIVSLSLLLFFSYGHVYYVLSNSLPGFDFGHRHLLFIWIVMALLLIYSSKKFSKYLSTSTNFLNIMGASLVTLSLVQIISFEVSTRNVWKPSREFESGYADTDNSNYHPDIYYIILDTYASASTLKEFYGFENGEFIDWLENRGFYVAEESFSN